MRAPHDHTALRPVATAAGRTGLRILLVATFMTMLGLAAVPPAKAHAFLLHSSPSDGSTLDRAPTTMTLAFDQDILVYAASLTLRSADGSVLLRTRPPIVASRRGAPRPVLAIGLPPLLKGTYSATWQVQSADDLHRTSGTVSFAVGPTSLPQAATGPGPAPPVLSSALRWLDLTGIAVLLGALLLLSVVVPRSRLTPDRAAELRTQLWRVMAITAGVASLTGIAVLLDAVGPTNVVRVSISGTFGRLWLLREVGFCGVACLSRLAMHRTGSARRYTIATIALTAASLTAVSGSSHVGAAADRPFALLLLLLHLSASGAWAGGVLLLVWLLIFERRRDVGFRSHPLLRAFGAPAFGCVAVALVTGIALGGRQVASPDGLLSSPYGRILILKVLMVGIAGLLGLRTSLLLRPVRPRRRTSLSRGLLVESAALLLTLAAGAALSVGTPARGPAFNPSTPVGPSVISTQVGDLVESAALAPNAVGKSWLRVDVSQTRRPAPAPVVGVTASLLGPDAVATLAMPLTRTEIANRWELGGVHLNSPGLWRLTVAVQRAGHLDNVWRVNWRVPSGRVGARKPLVSDRPWKSGLDRTALVLAMVLLAGGLTSRWSSRRRQRRLPTTANSPSHIEDRVLVRL